MIEAAANPMPSRAFDAHTYVLAAAPAVGFALSDADVAAVAVQLERAAHFASIVAATLDDPMTAPAPVFVPIGSVSKGVAS